MAESLSLTLEQLQQRVNTQLSNRLASLDIQPQLKAALQHSVLLGGKRARPCLVYLTGEMLNLDPARLDTVAMALEMIHAYSLVHDDLPAMDDDELRRGQPTCHVKFDEATAILAGDILQSLAFNLLSEAEIDAQQKVQLIQILSSSAFEMCDGQALDLAATGQTQSEQQLNRLHSRKTGALIAAAVTMPSVLASTDAETHQQLDRYAKHIGLAFQIRDDVLDVISDSETLGKPQGSDKQMNKTTYPDLLGIEGAQLKAEQLLTEALQVLAQLPYNTEPLAQFAKYLINRKY